LTVINRETLTSYASTIQTFKKAFKHKSILLPKTLQLINCE